MNNEIAFIVFIIAPWILVLAAVLFYRKRRLRKTLDDSDGGRKGGAGDV